MADKDVILVRRPVEMRPIPGFEGRYSITCTGRVWSHGVIKSKPKWLKPGLNHRGYLGLVIAGKSRSIHLLVMAAWGPPKPSNKHQVNHIDSNKRNNYYKNLEWVTGRQNIQHALANGRILVGSSCNLAKLTETDIIEIRLQYAKGKTIAALKHEFNVTYVTIWRIVKRHIWRHV